MKKIVSFTTDGSTGLPNIELIVRNLKAKFNFKISAKTKHLSKFHFRCIISADANEEQTQTLIKEVFRYASDALLESNN